MVQMARFCVRADGLCPLHAIQGRQLSCRREGVCLRVSELSAVWPQAGWNWCSIASRAAWSGPVNGAA